MLVLEVKSKRYNARVELKHKITIVRGPSGKGKTIFASVFMRKNEAFKTSVSDSRYTVVPLITGWELVIEGSIQHNKPCVYIIDDVDFFITDTFSRLYKKDTLSYYLIINRFENISLRSFNRVPFSVHAIFDFVTDGKNHWLEPTYQLDNIDKLRKDSDVLVEDSKLRLSVLQQINR